MRGPVAFSVLVVGCGIALAVPAAGRCQKDETVFVGHGKIARRTAPSSSTAAPRKPDPGSTDSTAERGADGWLDEAPPGHSIEEIEELERDCLAEVNHQRLARGLPAMAHDAALLAVARSYSRQMVEERFFAHIDPEGLDVRQRLEKARITWQMVGENLSYSNGYINPVATSVRGWMESPGHRRNILEARYNDSAIGVWIAPDGTIYFTEIFLRK